VRQKDFLQSGFESFAGATRHIERPSESQRRANKPIKANGTVAII